MTKVIRLNCKYCHASGLAGFFIRASTEDGGTPRTFADASSRPHNDMGASLFMNSVHFLYTSGEYYQNPRDRTVIGEKASSAGIRGRTVRGVPERARDPEKGSVPEGHPKSARITFLKRKVWFRVRIDPDTGLSRRHPHRISPPEGHVVSTT